MNIKAMKLFFILLFLTYSISLIKAQGYKANDSTGSVHKNGIPPAFLPGDIILNFNYGAPQITPFILKTALNIYNKNKKNDDYAFAITNSGVLNAKIEYAVNDNLGVGFASSYWNMTAAMYNNYRGTDPTTGIGASYTDNYLLSVSALAFGIRGNYHIIDELKSDKLDPYFGLTLGATKYTYGLTFNSTYPDKKAPETYDFFNSGFGSRFLKSGWSSYVSTTFGIRWFPVKYVGINAEAGWDRGAFLFGGVALKFHARHIKSLNN